MRNKNSVRVLLPLILTIAATGVAFAVTNLQPLDSEDLNFGSCTMNLETMSCSPSQKEETIRFVNVYSNPSISETVYKMGVFNSGYANKAFAVYNPDTGYSKERIFRYDTNIPKDSQGQTSVRFSPESDSVQSCIDNQQTECSLSSTIYVQPYYCNSSSPPSDCYVHDGLEIHAQGTVVFALPSISYSSTNLNFGQVEVGQTKTLTLTITNNSSNEDFRFLVYELPDDFSSDQTGQTLTVSTNSSRSLNITFTPASAGTQSATIYFSDLRAGIGKILGLGSAISLSGEGVEPTPTPTPTTAPTTPSTTTPTPTTTTPSTTEPTTTTPSTTTPTTQTGAEQTGTTEFPSTTQPSESETTAPTTAAPTPIPVWVAEGDDYKVTVSAPSIPEGLKEDQGFVIRGKAEPFAKIMLYIYSDPIVVEVQADENGDWTYALPKGLDAGKHEILAATINNGGKELTEPVKIAEFEVISKAQAATEPTPPTEAKTPTTQKGINWTISILATATALLLGVVYYWKIYKKRSTAAIGESEETLPTPEGPQELSSETKKENYIE